MYIMHTPENYSAPYVSVVLTSEIIPEISSWKQKKKHFGNIDVWLVKIVYLSLTNLFITNLILFNKLKKGARKKNLHS